MFFIYYLLVYTAPVALAQPSSIGIVKSFSGEVVRINAESTTQVVPNMKFSQGDAIRTGDNSSVGLIFEDDTVVSFGPNSEMQIQCFLFNPVDKELSFVTRLLRGAFSFISG